MINEMTIQINGKDCKFTYSDDAVPVLGDVMQALADCFANGKQSKTAKESKTGFERAKPGEKWYRLNEPAYYIAGDDDDFETACYDDGDYFSDEKLRSQATRAYNLFAKLTRFAVEHGGIGTVEKGYEIDYAPKWDGLTSIECCGTSAFTPIFATEYAANMAMEEYREDLMWYFTQYLPMLKGEK